MGKLGRYTEKPELGPEETNFGEGKEESNYGKPGNGGHRKNKKAQRPVGHPTIGAFGLARLQRKTGRAVAICKVLNTKEPINFPLSHEGHRQKLQIRASVLERSIWSLCTKRRGTGKPIKVALEKEIRERGGMGVGQGSKENGKKDCSWRHFFFFKKHRTFVTRDKNGKSL